jgi:Tfp pilus assembly protein PilF
LKSNNYTNATIAYNSGDYIKALEGYYNCLTSDSAGFDPGDAGLVYHRLGNCLVKVERYEEAVSVYRKSLDDPAYQERGSLHVNLGTALSALSRYDDAIEEFQAALGDDAYSTPYRAQMGMGNALSKLGRIVEAGSAYRTAALDANNPNPVKALMNLGASFSALDRPGDAVEAYLAILDFRVTGNTLNRTYERLAGAYFADGQYAKAIQAFNDALLGGNYQLSERSQAQMAQARLAITSPDEALAIVGMDATVSPYPHASLEDSSSLQPLDADISGSYLFGTEHSTSDDIDFFTASDAELIAASKRQYKRERSLRHTGLKVFFALLVLVVLALGGAIFAFMQGYGWPTQETAINGFFDSYAAGRETVGYWVPAAMDKPVEFSRMLQAVVKADSSHVTIRHLDRSLSESEALLQVRLDGGGYVHYKVSLVRDGIGWKINGIELVFASQNP